MLTRICSNLQRRCKLLLDGRYLSLAERLKIVSTVHINQAADSTLARRIVDGEGRSYLPIGNYRVTFEPPYAVADKDRFRAAMCQIARESFVFPNIYAGQVFVRPGDTVMDLGACIGTTALALSRSVGPSGKVIAVEPIMHQAIRTNAELNRIGNIVVIPKGVSDKKGNAVIEMGDFCIDASMAARQHTNGYYSCRKEIELTTVDDLADELGLDRLDFIKMDIEGVEELAIRGAERVIRKFRPKWSVSSYHVDYANEPQHKKLLAALKKLGYRISERHNEHIYAW